MEKPNFKKMCLMYVQQLTNFPYIEKDFDALTDYQLLCKVVAYLNKVIKNENTQNEAITALYNAFVALKDYVDNYFDTTDFQSMVNQKLDEMASDGTLVNLLSNYLYIERVYNTLDEMIEDETIQLGNHIKVFGTSEINDGYGGNYIITSDDGILLNNGLYAKVLNNFEENYYDEITYEKHREYNTDYYITRIPLNDKFNKMIPIYIANNTSSYSPNKYAQKENTNVTINATLNIERTELENVGRIPSVIGNGVILRTYDDNSNLPDCYKYVGFKADRSYEQYNVNNTTAQEMLDDGVINCFDVFYPLIEDGQRVDFSTIHPVMGDDVITNVHPRQCLGVLADKTIIILTSEARSSDNVGLTSLQTQNILMNLHCEAAWNLDGGGSTSTSIKGVKINQNYDNFGKNDRVIPFTLNVKKTPINKNIQDIYSFIGKNNQDIFQWLMPLYKTLNIETLDGLDADTLIGRLIIGYGNSIINRPGLGNGWLINFTHDESDLKSLYNKQLFLTRDFNRIYQREMVNGVWSTWEYPDQQYNVRLSADVSANVLSVTQDYQSIIFASVYGDDLSTGKISYDETTKKKITINHTGHVKITAILSIDSKGSNEKFIRIIKNGTFENPSLTKANIANNTSGYLITTGIYYVSPKDEFEVQLYGDENDKVYRGEVVIETLK